MLLSRLLRPFLSFYFLLACLLIIPIHTLIKNKDRYNDLNTFTYIILVLFIIILISYLLLTVSNHIEVFIYQRKNYGWVWIKNISAIWKIKQRTPYSFFNTKSLKRRTKYYIVIIQYILFSLVCVILHNFYPNEWYSDLLIILILISFSHVITQFLLHGRTPTILILGNSNKKTVDFNNLLNFIFMQLGVASLVNSEVSQEKLLKYSGQYFRTLKIFDSQWSDSVKRLIRITNIIVVDLRGISPVVIQEVGWVLSTELDNKKIFFLTEKNFDIPHKVLYKIPYHKVFDSELRCISAIRKAIWIPKWMLKHKYSQLRKMNIKSE